MNIAMLMIISLGGLIAVILIVGAVLWTRFRSKARNLGYPSVGRYLAAAPRSDEEKRDAVNLALQGVVVCICGLLFPPFLLIGLFPLFYGARKVAWASMGLGLVDDADQPGR
jgi:hypothetical protein